MSPAGDGGVSEVWRAMLAQQCKERAKSCIVVVVAETGLLTYAAGPSPDIDLALEADFRRRSNTVLALLDEWAADESGYDEETWPKIKEALDESRRAADARVLFPDDE